MILKLLNLVLISLLVQMIAILISDTFFSGWIAGGVFAVISYLVINGKK